MAYEVRFADDVKEHLRALSVPERSAALEAIERELPYEPLVETRNRKPLRPNPIAPWESCESASFGYSMKWCPANQVW